MQQLENYAQKQIRAQQEVRDPIVAELQQQVSSFEKASEKLSSQLLSDLETDMNKQLKACMQRYRMFFEVCCLICD